MQPHLSSLPRVMSLNVNAVDVVLLYRAQDIYRKFLLAEDALGIRASELQASMVSARPKYASIALSSRRGCRDALHSHLASLVPIVPV